MNQINFLGNRVQILSSINEEGITQLREYLHPIDAVLFYNYHPVETDLMQLNTFFKTNKTAYLTGVGKGYLKHLPDLAHVQFSGFTQSGARMQQGSLRGVLVPLMLTIIGTS